MRFTTADAYLLGFFLLLLTGKYSSQHVLVGVRSFTAVPSPSSSTAGRRNSSASSWHHSSRHYDDASRNSKAATGRSQGKGRAFVTPLAYSKGRDYNSEDDSQEETKIPQLPAIGSSSSSSSSASSKNSKNSDVNDNRPFVASKKFQLQYTCNICETRNMHSVSRLAYRQGVVITRCAGCDSQHLIADHLGWTDYEGGFQGNETNTIEDYFANAAASSSKNTTTSDDDSSANVVVSRVTPEVFDLEKILKSHDASSGSIVGDDGELALE